MQRSSKAKTKRQGSHTVFTSVNALSSKRSDLVNLDTKSDSIGRREDWQIARSQLGPYSWNPYRMTSHGPNVVNGSQYNKGYRISRMTMDPMAHRTARRHQEAVCKSVGLASPELFSRRPMPFWSHRKMAQGLSRRDGSSLVPKFERTIGRVDAFMFSQIRLVWKRPLTKFTSKWSFASMNALMNS